MTEKETDILNLLRDVMDPEIPTLSIVDLGIVTGIKAQNSGQIDVTLTPTFSGCPALKVMEEMVAEKLRHHGYDPHVSTNFDVPWNTNMITEAGLEALRKHGLAPPPKHDGYIELDILSDTPCPLCGSRNTELRSPFGPTLCRSIHYCNNCKNAFEAFKPVS